jgi:hypothetical protein
MNLRKENIIIPLCRWWVWKQPRTYVTRVGHRNKGAFLFSFLLWKKMLSL